MKPADAIGLLAAARTGHLATVRPDGRPHIVVVTFTLVGDHVVTAIDRKPKTTKRLQRLRNIESGSKASFLVDHYDDDWSRLWWVRVDGPAEVHGTGPFRAEALTALGAKYSQYVDQPPDGPVIAVTIEDVTSWTSTP